MQITRTVETCRMPAQQLAQMSDEQLVELINLLNHHHHRAFHELAERYRPWIYRRSRMQLGNHPDAEDATQIILKRVYEKLHLYRGEARFSHWLNRVVDNQCSNYYHAQKRHRLMHDTCDTLDEQDDYHDAHQSLGLQLGQQLIHQLETRQAVNRVLEKLSPEQNEILRLRFYKELSLKQIAERLGLSLSATKARLYRSLEKFQAIYRRLIENNACSLMA